MIPSSLLLPARTIAGTGSIAKLAAEAAVFGSDGVLVHGRSLEASGTLRAVVDAAPRGLRINDYVSVIQSVMQGQGIVLGWAHLVDRMVENGSLVRLTDHVHRTGRSFNVSWPKTQAITGNVALVRDWLAAQQTSPTKPV